MRLRHGGFSVALYENLHLIKQARGDRELATYTTPKIIKVDGNEIGVRSISNVFSHRLETFDYEGRLFNFYIDSRIEDLESLKIFDIIRLADNLCTF